VQRIIAENSREASLIITNKYFTSKFYIKKKPHLRGIYDVLRRLNKQKVWHDRRKCHCLLFMSVHVQ